MGHNKARGLTRAYGDHAFYELLFIKHHMHNRLQCGDGGSSLLDTIVSSEAEVVTLGYTCEEDITADQVEDTALKVDLIIIAIYSVQ